MCLFVLHNIDYELLLQQLYHKTCEIKYKKRKETKLQRKSNTKQQINIESMWKN